MTDPFTKATLAVTGLGLAHSPALPPALYFPEKSWWRAGPGPQASKAELMKPM